MTARTVPTMPDWTTAQEITSSLLNQITAYARFWANPPMFRMYQSAAQSINSGTYTQVLCDTGDYDTDSGRAIATPWSYTIPASMAGRWDFKFKFGFAINATGNRLGALYKNGTILAATEVGGPATAATNNPEMAGGDRILCAAGDVISLWTWQNSGGALNTYAGSCMFSGQLVSLANP